MERQSISNQFIYGGDYNPEQWLDRPDILARDLEMMQKARINTVTLGVFSWSTLEPEEGVFRLEWLKEMVDNLYAHGIRVILATPSGARPRWLAETALSDHRRLESRLVDHLLEPYLYLV